MSSQVIVTPLLPRKLWQSRFKAFRLDGGLKAWPESSHGHPSGCPLLSNVDDSLLLTSIAVSDLIVMIFIRCGVVAAYC